MRVLYTGFDLDNIQQIVNCLQWGLDNWVYGCRRQRRRDDHLPGEAGHEAARPARPRHPLPARTMPGSLEPTSGGGQYGLTCDEAQHWFTATNSQHLRQIVLPDHYLRRNPYLRGPGRRRVDIPEHGAACKVFRISPFEAWRVERTTRRKGGPDAKRFPPTELVPGGFITSACSPCYLHCRPLFPEKYRGSVFVCDPANNLIHRDLLEPNGPIFKAQAHRRRRASSSPRPTTGSARVT